MGRVKSAAAIGILSALVGLALGDLAAAMVEPDASPVLVAGTQLIDLTPTPVKEWAVARFGTADKPILIGGVAVVVLAAASAAGALAGRGRPVAAALLYCSLGGLAAVLALLRPSSSAVDLVPALVTACAAVVVLAALSRIRGSTPKATGRSRRALLTAGLVLLVAVATESLARQIVNRRTTPDAIALPRPRTNIPDLPRGLRAPGITPFRTPRRDFYRVDTRLALPVIDVDSWRLGIDGSVERPLSFTFDDLAAMDLVERDVTLTCVSNEVGGRYVGGARWLGVRLTDLLEQARVGDGPDQILSTDVDGMTISTPLAIATDGRDSMIAIGMNGAPLPREHGFPARLIVPGLYGFVGATKWITRMTLTTYAEQEAYWTKRGWATTAPIKPSSRIDTPRPFQTIRHGEEVTVGGIAWAQNDGGVASVEVSIDDGPWQPAVLGPSGGPSYWRQWYMTWTATPGAHTIAARANSARGRVQTAKRATPFPSGSSGIQRLAINVA